METFTGAEGALGLALTTLLVVTGYRLAAPRGTVAWAAVLAYVLALVAIHAGALGTQHTEPPAILRVAGALGVVTGLVMAGTSARAARRLAHDLRAGAPAVRSGPLLPAGLAMALLGQLVRAPSRGGTLAVALAVLLLGWTAVTSWRRRGAAMRTTC